MTKFFVLIIAALAAEAVLSGCTADKSDSADTAE
jgi:hypothetical protein